MKDFFKRAARFLRQHFAVRFRSLDRGVLCGCFGPVCFCLSVYRCGVHTTGADAIAHLKKEEL